jgi:DNA polymerase-1
LRKHKGGIVTTLYGRVIRESEEGFTDALNHPIQGSGADLLKLATVMLWNKLKAFSGKARILNLVHDEIVVCCEDSIKTQIAFLVRNCMEDAAKQMMPQVLTPVEVKITDAVRNTLEL